MQNSFHGRTGKWFAYQHYDIMPDIITLAKGTAGGLPMGVMIANEKVSGYFKLSMHASTFGGSLLVWKVALGVGVIDTIVKKLLKNARGDGRLH
jgi:acetylornithine/succinyldiaminopimelate/putrescine aminotransferase